MGTTEKIKIIYIAGSGHCGSTLLDLIIGSSPETFSGGELSFFNIYNNENEYNRKNPEYLCTCGRKFSECPLWTKIKEQRRFHIKKYFSLKENIIILYKIIFSPAYRHKKYTDDSYELLYSIKKEVGKDKKELKYVLDSSKDPRRLFYLMNDPRLEVFPILLKRNPLLVARSYINTGNRLLYALIRKERFASPSAGGWAQRLQLPFFVIMAWMINILSLCLIKQDQKGMVIAYKDLCRRPSRIINKINKQLGINISENNYLQEVNSQTFHNIEGNNFRFRKIKEIKEK